MFSIRLTNLNLGIGTRIMFEFLYYFINRESKSAAYFLKTEDGGVACTYCHMEQIRGCGGGGWTLVMKIDGAKVSFTLYRVL